MGGTELLPLLPLNKRPPMKRCVHSYNLTHAVRNEAMRRGQCRRPRCRVRQVCRCGCRCLTAPTVVSARMYLTTTGDTGCSAMERRIGVHRGRAGRANPLKLGDTTYVCSTPEHHLANPTQGSVSTQAVHPEASSSGPAESLLHYMHAIGEHQIGTRGWFHLLRLTRCIEGLQFVGWAHSIYCAKRGEKKRVVNYSNCECDQCLGKALHACMQACRRNVSPRGVGASGS